MDPDTALEEIVQLALEIESGQTLLTSKVGQATALRLSELVSSLDAWIRKGGYPPRRWRQQSAPIIERPLLGAKICSDCKSSVGHDIGCISLDTDPQRARYFAGDEEG